MDRLVATSHEPYNRKMNVFSAKTMLMNKLKVLNEINKSDNINHKKYNDKVITSSSSSSDTSSSSSESSESELSEGSSEDIRFPHENKEKKEENITDEDPNEEDDDKELGK